MGDSPAAKLARQENVIRPPVETFKPPPPPPTQPATPSALNRPIAGAKPATPATAATAPPARKKWRTEEPEPKRCPGCGTKTLAARCPGCGTKLHSDDE
jgi:hypothetical protein